MKKMIENVAGSIQETGGEHAQDYANTLRRVRIADLMTRVLNAQSKNMLLQSVIHSEGVLGLVAKGANHEIQKEVNWLAERLLDDDVIHKFQLPLMTDMRVVVRADEKNSSHTYLVWELHGEWMALAAADVELKLLPDRKIHSFDTAFEAIAAIDSGALQKARQEREEHSLLIDRLYGIINVCEKYIEYQVPSCCLTNDGRQDGHWTSTLQNILDALSASELDHYALTALSISRCYGPTPLFDDDQARIVLRWLWPDKATGAWLEWDELQNQLYDLIDNLELAQLQKDGLRPEPMDVPELVIRPASEVDAQAATEAEEGYNE